MIELSHASLSCVLNLLWLKTDQEVCATVGPYTRGPSHKRSGHSGSDLLCSDLLWLGPTVPWTYKIMFTVGLVGQSRSLVTLHVRFTQEVNAIPGF